MHLRHNFRLDPSPGQRIALGRAFGCARVVFNDALHSREQAHNQGLPYISDTEVMRQVVTLAKRTPERAWLAEVSAVVLQQAVVDLNTAYRNFFESISGKRAGPGISRPRYRSAKDSRQAVRFTRNARFQITPAGRLRLPKVGDVRVRWSRTMPGAPSSVTVVRDAGFRYFASFIVEVEPDILPTSEHETAIDLGLSSFATFPDGRQVAAPKFIRAAERTLKRRHRDLTRKQPGSNNRTKARLKFARAHSNVADARRDWHHKLSTTIIRENQVVYVEDLAILGLARGRLAKSVHDAGWATSLGMLAYKAARHGRSVIRVNRFEPTTRKCSHCGWLGPRLDLSVRTFRCAPCGLILDRDVNAAKNILAAGRAERRNACGGQVRPDFGHRSKKQEANGVSETARTEISARDGGEHVKWRDSRGARSEARSGGA